MTVANDNGTAPRDIEWLLKEHGPYFLTKNPLDDEVFQRLDAFGLAIWQLDSHSQRQFARDTWIEHLEEYALIPNNSWRMVQVAIEAGEKSVPSPGSEIQWYSVQELAELTPPAPLLGDLIAEQSFALMYGPHGCGKTFIAVDMALSIATGQPWHGVDVIQGPVGYILGEGRGGIASRVQAWHQAHGIPDDTAFRVVPQPVDFLEPARVTALLASVQAWDTPPKLLVIDTLYRCFGGSENETADMAAFISSVGRFQRETGAAVLVLHHPGHDTTRGRGHSALPQAVDTIIKVVESDGLITFSCDKQRDGPPFDKRCFRLSPRGHSMTVELAADAAEHMPASAESALATLHGIAASDGVSNTDWKKATKLADRTFQRTAKALHEGGWVEKKDGRYYVTEEGENALGLDR